MKLLKLFTLCCIIAIIFQFSTTSYAFGDNGGDGDFQPNPFLSPLERERAFKKQQKLEANRLIEDPRPVPRRNGPPSDYQFDQELPLTIGDVLPLNNDYLRPILNDLVQTAYFRYYKVNLHSECPYWAMNRMCTSGGGCNVCECTENEIPKPWRIESTDPIANTPEKDVFPGFDLGYGDNHNALHKKETLLSNWDVHVWSDAEKEQAEQAATYVNLLENVEGNTGYSGEEPRRIWDAIYNENCFARIGHSNVTDMCFQDRLMYRLISGLHSSISAHVFKNWKLNDDWTYIHNQFLWNMLFTTQRDNMSPIEFQNLSLSKDPNDIVKFKKIIENDNKVLERINNLFFTLEVLLESLSTLYHTPILPFTNDLTDIQCQNAIIINTGDYEQDSHTAKLLSKLVTHAYTRGIHYTPSTRTSIAQSLIPPPTMHSTFATLGPDHIENMRHLFHNVSVIMNCVGCEKCRIWSKLNILGIATGLKLAASKSTKNTASIITSLKRNEIIAFVNTINSFSEAVHFINSLSVITTGLQEDRLTDTVDIVNLEQDNNVIIQPSPQPNNNDQQTQEAKQSKQSKQSKDTKEVSTVHKIIMVLMTIGTIGIIVWRLTLGPPLSIAQMEKVSSSRRAIPKQQQQRREIELENAKNVLTVAPALKSPTPSLIPPPLVSSTTGKSKNRKID